MQTFEVSLFETFDDAEPIWRAAEETADMHVFQRFDWLNDWYRLVGKASVVQPCFVVVHDTSGQPLILLPLAIERRGLWRVLIWMGAEFFDYHAPILTPDASIRIQEVGNEVIWTAIRSKLRRLDYADFERQPASIGNQHNPFQGLSTLQCTQSAHHTNLFSDWPSYYASKRGRRTRHNDRRKRKKLENEGQLNFVVANNIDTSDRLIASLMQQKSVYARTLGKSNLLERDGYNEFLQQRAEGGLRDGSVVVCGLELDGEILAAQWGAVHEQRLYSIVASYVHNSYSKFSPGDILLHDLMKWCFEHDIKVFDFTYGDEPYKLAWCEHHVPLYRSLLPLTVWGALPALMLKWQLMLRYQAKRSKWLSHIYIQSRNLLNSNSTP